MKLRIAIPIILTSTSLVLAQLLPQKPAEEVKLDRALVFKVDYNDGAKSPDSTSGKINSSIKTQEKGDFLKNALVWTGLCFTGAALSAVFGGNGPVNCDPDAR